MQGRTCQAMLLTVVGHIQVRLIQRASFKVGVKIHEDGTHSSCRPGVDTTASPQASRHAEWPQGCRIVHDLLRFRQAQVARSGSCCRKVAHGNFAEVWSLQQTRGH